MPPPKSSYVDYDLSSLSIGLSKKIDEVEKSQHFTKPPSRYSEASLVKELEKGYRKTFHLSRNYYKYSR